MFSPFRVFVIGSCLKSRDSETVLKRSGFQLRAPLAKRSCGSSPCLASSAALLKSRSCGTLLKRSAPLSLLLLPRAQRSSSPATAGRSSNAVLLYLFCFCLERSAPQVPLPRDAPQGRQADPQAERSFLILWAVPRKSWDPTACAKQARARGFQWPSNSPPRKHRR